jgi:hypothetical protein
MTWAKIRSWFSSETTRGKNVIVGLIYPSVLGTFIYDPIKMLYQKLHQPHFFETLKANPEGFFIKGGLVIAILSFYICDYLYSNVIKKYKKLFLFFDLAVILFMIFAFNGINLERPLFPNFNTVSIAFGAFVLLFLLWDSYLVRKASKEKCEQKREDMLFLYVRLALWEILSLLVLVVSYLFWVQEIIDYFNSLFILFSNIFLSSIFYFYNVAKKTDLENKYL